MTMKTSTAKRAHEKVVRTTISMPPLVFTFGLNHAREGGFTSFSDYIQDLIRLSLCGEGEKICSAGVVDFQ